MEFERLSDAKSTTYVVKDDIAVVTPEMVTSLKTAAASDPLHRARLCLHRSRNDAVHQMIIVHHEGTYTRPHRHRNKTESFNMIEGRLAVLFFDDAGAVTQTVVLGPPGSKEPSVYRLSSARWHTVIPLTSFAVFHEITNGPFVAGDSDQAAWAPAEGDAASVRDFLSGLRRGVPA